MAVQLNTQYPQPVLVEGKFNFLTKIARVGLKTLSILAIGGGTFSAIGGAVLLSKLAVSSILFTPLFFGGIALAVLFLCISAALSVNKFARYGLILTVPTAAFCAGFPFLVPVIAGSLPGIGLIALGVKGFSTKI